MKQNDLYTVLHTDVRTLLHRLCFALCPPRVQWPTDEHLGDQELGNAAAAESISDTWSSSGILWGNSLFWSGTPTWGHSAGPESTAADAYVRSEYYE